MSRTFGDIVKKVKSFRTSSNSTLNPAVSAFPGPGTVDVPNHPTNLEEEMEWIQVDRSDVESIIELDQDTLDIGETQMKRLDTREDVPFRMIPIDKEDRDERDVVVEGMDAAHSRSESNKSDPDPKSNPNLNKALPPLPLELEFNQSPLRLVSHSGSFRTITSSACPAPGTRIGTRTGLPALTRPLPPASARAQSRPQPWKSRAATDNTFDFALEDLFDPDSPLQAKIARNTASRLITSTRELSLVVPTTTTRSMPDLVKDQAAERVPSPETEPEPESVNQLSRLLPRSLLSMKQLETGTNRNHAFNSMDMTTDMDIENLITDDDDNTDVVGVQRQINQKKPINLVDHDQSQKSHTHNNTSVDHIERIKDQAPPLSQPNSSPLPTPGATTTTQPPIIPTTAVNKKKIYNRLDSIDVANLNNSKPSQSTTPPASSSSLQQPTDVDTDMVPTTPSARDGRLSFGPGLSEDDLQRNAKVLASLARRVKKRVSN